MNKNFLNENLKELKSIKYQHQKKLLSLFCKESYSCKELSKITKLSNVAIYRLLEEFVKKDVLTANVIDENAKGRKPVIYSLNINFGYFLIFDFTLPKFKIGVFNIKRQPVYLTEYNFNAPIDKKSLQNIIKETYETIKNFSIESQIINIGISIAGRINKQNGYFVASSSFVDPININIKQIVEEYFKCPIYIKNNVALALISALNVYNLELDNGIFLYLNNENLGSSILLNGNIFNGENNFAGEIAATQYDGHFIFPSLISFRQEKEYLNKKYNEKHFSEEQIMELYANENDLILKEFINEKIKMLANLLNNYLAIIDCNTILVDCYFASFNKTTKNLLYSELENLCGYYTKPQIIFIKHLKDTFLNGCLDYTIQKGILNKVK